MLVAGVILAGTYVGIAFTRLPRVNLDRPAAALLGGLLMLLAGVLTFDQAVAAVDFHTLALLLGMMLLIAVLQRAGFFTLLAARATDLASTPARLLATVVVATAVASAFLVNDVVVLLFTPVVIRACRMQRLNPIPYLIGEAMASNIGSTATIVGNPQNMLIGVVTGIPFARFFAYLAPIAVVSTALLLGVLWAFYRDRLRATSGDPADPPSRAIREPRAVGAPLAVSEAERRLLWRSLPILVLVIAAFFVSSFLGLAVPLIALTAGAIAVLASGIRPAEVIQSVDWALLVFFAGLFVVIGGAREAGVLDIFFEHLDFGVDAGGIAFLHLFSALASQAVSNVPLTVLMIPLLKQIPGEALWISLAAGATLGGNATIIGAVANIIVVEQAYREGVEVRFGEFLRVGVVVTALTLAASVGILVLEFQTGLLR